MTYLDKGKQYDESTGAEWQVYIGDKSVLDDFAKLHGIPARYYRPNSIRDEDSRIIQLPMNEMALHLVEHHS